SFYDAALKLTYDITPQQNVSFYGLGGHTHISDSGPYAIDVMKDADADFEFFRAGWRWALSPRLLLESRAAYVDQPFERRNINSQLLARDSYGEWVGGSSVVWNWRRNSVLDAGWTLRRLRDNFAS